MKLEKSCAAAHLRLHNLSLSDYEEKHGTPEPITSNESQTEPTTYNESLPGSTTSNESLPGPTCANEPAPEPMCTDKSDSACYPSRDSNISQAVSTANTVASTTAHAVPVYRYTTAHSLPNDVVPEPGFPLSWTQQQIHPPGFINYNF